MQIFRFISFKREENVRNYKDLYEKKTLPFSYPPVFLQVSYTNIWKFASFQAAMTYLPFGLELGIFPFFLFPIVIRQ